MKIRNIYLLFFFLFNTHFVSANHILSAYMQYQHIAGNEYQITLKIYTDNAFGTPADNPLFLSLYQESQNNYDLLNTIEVTPFVGTQISLTQDDCVTAPLFFDIIEFTYIFRDKCNG